MGERQPRTSAYLADGRVVRTMVLYGTPAAPGFTKVYGDTLALIGVPEDAEVRTCDEYGGDELFCSQIVHAGAEAVLSFACDEADRDFVLVRTRHPELQPYVVG